KNRTRLFETLCPAASAAGWPANRLRKLPGAECLLRASVAGAGRARPPLRTSMVHLERAFLPVCVGELLPVCVGVLLGGSYGRRYEPPLAWPWAYTPGASSAPPSASPSTTPAPTADRKSTRLNSSH